MTLRRLLDAPRRAHLRARLDAALAGAPENGVLSITLALDAETDPCFEACWQATDFTRTNVAGWMLPASGNLRLALGCAMILGSAGPARFPALQAAFAGIAPHWRHDAGEAGGHPALAHVGFAFDEEALDVGPDELPNARLVLPAILLQRHAGRDSVTFSCAVRDAETAIERWQDALAAATLPPRQRPEPAGPLRRRPTPLADRAFLARVRAALADIGRGTIAKVVLTRRAQLDAGRRIDPARVLAALAASHPECTVYGIGQRGRSFVGATPERLVALRDGVVRADALAGTSWGDAAERPVLRNDKNSREQQLVVDAVRAALAPLCVSLAAPQAPEVMQVRELQHLRTSVAGRVHAGVGLFDLIARLHPTPAVGGTPGPLVRRWLRAHREQRAAWYTGGIGWIDRHGDGEIAVALRCAQIDGARAELFAGAGIVAGSDAQQELAETEAKFGPLLAALDASGRAGSADPARRTGTQ